MGKSLLEISQTEQLKQPACTADILAGAKPETGVPPGTQMREQGVILKHHPHSATLWRNPAPLSSHKSLLKVDTPSGGLLKTCDQSQQGGFTATGGAEQTQQLPLRHLKIDPLKGPTLGSIAVAMPDTVQLNRRLHREQLFHRFRQLGNGQSL